METMNANKKASKRKRQLLNSKGVSILEVVISTAVFSIGILAMAALQTASINSNYLADKVQTNSNITSSEIEELMAADYDDNRIANDIPSVEFKESLGGQLFINDDPPVPNDRRYAVVAQPTTDKAIPAAKKVVVTTSFFMNGVMKDITLKIFKPAIR